MSKAIALGAFILCASVFLRVSCSLEKATIARSLIIGVANSSTVAFHGHLYTVSKNQSHIHINSTNDNNYKDCDIAIDPTRDIIQGRLEVTSTDEELFIVGVQSVNRTKIDQYTTNDQYKYTLLRVDPRHCVYKAVAIPEANNDSHGDYYLPRIVRHRDGTDVFYPNLKNCAPCRINNEGLRINEPTPQIPRDKTLSKSTVHEQHYVQYLDSMNVFFYVNHSQSFSYGDQITTLKVLDDDFKTIKERTADFSIDAISKQKHFKGYLGVCTKTIDRFLADATAYTDFRCFGLSTNLDITSSFFWNPADSRSKPLSDISYEFDEHGNSYISFAEDTELRLYIVDKDGKLINAIDMGEIDSRFKQYPDPSGFGFSEYSYWNVNGFLVGGQYCIVTKQSATYYSTPLQQVRCIDLKEYVKQ